MVQKTMLAGLLCCALSVFTGYAASASELSIGKDKVREMSVVVHTGSFRSTLTISSNEWRRMVLNRHVTEKLESAPPETDAYLEVSRGGQKTTYVIEAQYDLYNAEQKQRLRLRASDKAKLKGLVEGLRRRHYGKIYTWTVAKGFIPMKSIFTVTDVDTGLSFRVQRRAGANHADVQPLTKQDTAVMKQIYNGTWSWKRRAVLISSNGHRLAASMHGMPHGGDGIPGNGFAGHFCIHFQGSTTHGSGNVDPDHQLMIYKAGGKLDGYLQKASPSQVIDVFLIAMNQQDPNMLAKTFVDAHQADLQQYLNEMSQIKAIIKSRPLREETVEGFPLWANLPLSAVIYWNTSKEKKVMQFHLVRNSVWEPWKIESIK